MSERPILFSGEMVRAILDGRKTQTRRIVTKSTSYANAKWEHLHWDNDRITIDPGLGAGGYIKVPWWHPLDTDDDARDRVRCRWAIGDLLWVRETFQVGYDVDGTGKRWSLVTPTSGADSGRVFYRADGSADVPKWRPSIFMKREYSRITLKLTDVQPQRLKDINRQDAEAEGVDTYREGAPTGAWGAYHVTPQAAFRELWDQINGKRVPWESNPWVWVLSFEVAEVRS